MTTTQSVRYAVTGSDMRTAMAKVPTPVAIVTGVPDGSENPAGMVIGSFVSVSLEPPMVGFFVGNESTTWPRLRTATRIGISALSSDQASMCTLVSRKDPACFEQPSWTRAGSGAAGPPLLSGAVAGLHCRIVDETPAGDHVFVLLEVTDLVDANGAPLVFHDRAFTTVAA